MRHAVEMPARTTPRSRFTSPIQCQRMGQPLRRNRRARPAQRQTALRENGRNAVHAPYANARTGAEAPSALSGENERIVG